MDILDFIFPVAAVIVVGGTITFFVVRSERRLREDFAAVADRRGWVMDMGGRTAAGTRGRIVRPDPTGPETWEFAQITRTRSGSGGSSSTRSEWSDRGRRSPGGLWAFGPPLPAEAGALAANLVGMLDGPMGRALLGRVLGPIGEDLPGLRHVAAPGRKARGFALFTTADNPTAVDLDAIDAGLRGWHGGQNDQPILVAEPDRIRVLLPRAVKNAAEMEALVDLGRSLAAQFPLNHPDR